MIYVAILAFWILLGAALLALVALLVLRISALIIERRKKRNGKS